MCFETFWFFFHTGLTAITMRWNESTGVCCPLVAESLYEQKYSNNLNIVLFKKKKTKMKKQIN